MAYRLDPQPGGHRADTAAKDDATFQVSPTPIVENGGSSAASEVAESDALASPHRSASLYLMARDPRSLFAYWEIDWDEAFREQMPRDRKVHLRVSRADGSEEVALAVEPMAASCYVNVSSGDEVYTADLGYYEPAGTWNSVAVSAPVATPPESVEQAEAPDFATVPFHLSFQRMIDLLRVAKHENASLTAMLAELRARASSESGSTAITEQEREIVHALDEAAAHSRGGTKQEDAPDLWKQQNLERILGFGRTGTSPQGGFAGGS